MKTQHHRTYNATQRARIEVYQPHGTHRWVADLYYRRTWIAQANASHIPAHLPEKQAVTEAAKLFGRMRGFEKFKVIEIA